MTPTEKIARDLDESAVRFAVARFIREGKEVTVRAISEDTGIATHRVEPHLRSRLLDSDND